MGYYPFLVLCHERKFWLSVVTEKSLSRKRFSTVGYDRKFLVATTSRGLAARSRAQSATARARQMHCPCSSAGNRRTTHVVARAIKRTGVKRHTSSLSRYGVLVAIGSPSNVHDTTWVRMANVHARTTEHDLVVTRPQPTARMAEAQRVRPSASTS